MGMEQSVYIGVVVRCTHPKKRNEKRTKRFCGNCGYGSKKGLGDSMKFCPTCGHKLMSDISVVEVEQSFWQIAAQAEINEDQFLWLDPEGSQDIHYLGNNYTGYHWMIGEHDSVAQVVDCERIEFWLNAFNNDFGEEIDKLRPYYENISVEFMIKTDYR